MPRKKSEAVINRDKGIADYITANGCSCGVAAQVFGVATAQAARAAHRHGIAVTNQSAGLRRIKSDLCWLINHEDSDCCYNDRELVKLMAIKGWNLSHPHICIIRKALKIPPAPWKVWFYRYTLTRRTLYYRLGRIEWCPNGRHYILSRYKNPDGSRDRIAVLKSWNQKPPKRRSSDVQKRCKPVL